MSPVLSERSDAPVSVGEAPQAGHTVHVVLSAFRPGSSLDRQIESILMQQHDELRLWLRSDDADAATLRRLADWAARDPRVELADDRRERVGTAASYGRLIELALARGAGWIALADQDDEWRPEHLASSLAVARGSAAALADEPVLVHGDLELIDASGRRLAPSFFAHARIRHETRDPLRVLVVQNFVTGCASVFDRALAELALPIPGDAIMHDWWLALCAASSGRVLSRETATVRYRQHDSNQIGAQAYADVLRELGRRTFSLRRHSNAPLMDTVLQARALQQRLRARLPAIASPRVAARLRGSLGLLDRHLALFRPDVSRLRRSLGLWQLGVRRQDVLLDLSLKAKLLTTRLALDDAPEPPGEVG